MNAKERKSVWCDAVITLGDMLPPEGKKLLDCILDASISDIGSDARERDLAYVALTMAVCNAKMRPCNGWFFRLFGL